MKVLRRVKEERSILTSSHHRKFNCLETSLEETDHYTSLKKNWRDPKVLEDEEYS